MKLSKAHFGFILPQGGSRTTTAGTQGEEENLVPRWKMKKEARCSYRICCLERRKKIILFDQGFWYNNRINREGPCLKKVKQN